jgi:hypothetical protein
MVVLKVWFSNDLNGNRTNRLQSTAFQDWADARHRRRVVFEDGSFHPERIRNRLPIREIGPDTVLSAAFPLLKTQSKSETGFFSQVNAPSACNLGLIDALCNTSQATQ